MLNYFSAYKRLLLGSKGDINADKNNTLTVAIRNVDDVAIPFSMVAILPLPTCDYEKITLDQDTNITLGRHAMPLALKAIF